MEQIEAERLENKRNITNGNCTLFLEKRPRWCPHPSRISYTRKFRASVPWPPWLLFYGLQTNYKRKCMPSRLPFNLISLWWSRSKSACIQGFGSTVLVICYNNPSQALSHCTVLLHHQVDHQVHHQVDQVKTRPLRFVAGFDQMHRYSWASCS